MLLLFALSAYAQPSAFGGVYGYYGAGTPAPVYGSAVRPVASPYAPYGAYGAPAQAAPATEPADSAPENPAKVAADNRFDVFKANQVVRSADLNARGNNLFYNTPLNVLFPNDPSVGGLGYGLIAYGATVKAQAASIDQSRVEDEIDRFRATYPFLTPEDRDTLNDLYLQRESARNQKIRRTVQIIPPSRGLIPSTGSGTIAAFFERRANGADEQLAKNAYVDARRDFAQDPSRENWVGLANARDNRQQFEYRTDANTYDLLGSRFGNAGRLGPILRKKASQEKLNTGYRTLREAQIAYSKDPNEINRLEVLLARLFIRATSEEDDANDDEIAYTTLAGKLSARTIIGSQILNSKNFQDEANVWRKYNRLARYILFRKQAQAVQDQGGSDVAQRMMGLSQYGPQTNPNPSSQTRSSSSASS